MTRTVIPSSLLGPSMLIPENLVAAGDFDEGKHPRDNHGRFGDKDETPAEKASHTHLDGEEYMVFERKLHDTIAGAAARVGRSADPTIDLRLMAIEHQAEVADRFAKFGDEFPEALATVGDVRCVSFTVGGPEWAGHDSSFAMVRGVQDPDTGHSVQMVFNEDYFATAYGMVDGKYTVDSHFLENITQKCYDDGFHPAASPASIVDHELGHVLDMAAPPDVRPSDADIWSNKVAMVTEVSRYAATEPREGFAEAFALRQASGLDAIKDPEVRDAVRSATSPRHLVAAGGDDWTCRGYVPVGLIKTKPAVTKVPSSALALRPLHIRSVALTWDPNAHPRDDHGRFGDKGASDEDVLGVGAIRPTLGPGRLPIKVTQAAIESSAHDWAYFNPCENARFAAECMLGQDHPTVADWGKVIQESGDYSVLHALDAGKLLGEDDDKTQQAVDDAHNLLVGVRDAAPSDLYGYRGVHLDPDQPGTVALAALKPGDTFDLSLASVSNEPSIATQFAMNGSDRMMFTLEPGFKGVTSDDPTTPVENRPGSTEQVQGHWDVVTGGRMQVISRGPSENFPGTTEVRIRQVGVFDPDNRGELIDTRKPAAIAAAAGDRYQRAPFWQAFGPAGRKAIAPPMSAAGDFDEELHPRDHGKFATKDGGASDAKANTARLDRFLVKGTRAEDGKSPFAHDDVPNAKAALVEARGAELAAMLDERPELRAEYEHQMAYQSRGMTMADSLRHDYAEKEYQKRAQDSPMTDEQARSSQPLIAWAEANGGIPPTETLWGRDAANRYVGSWAQSAADQNAMSLAMQMSAADELGLESPSFDDYLNGLAKMDSGAQYVISDVASVRTDEGESMKAFARVEYDSTQRALADAGFKPDDGIELYRGMRFVAKDDGEFQPAPAGFPTTDGPNDVPVRVDLNPVSSWTVDRATALQPYFSGGDGYLLTDHVKVSDIISTARTGRGALAEGEVLVRNTPDRDVIVHRNDNTFAPMTAAVDPRRQKPALVYIDDPRHGWDDWIKHAPVTAAGDFDENQHPRDAHGRFGNKDDGTLPAFRMHGTRHTSDGSDVLVHRPDGSTIRRGDLNGELKDMEREAQLAKATIATDLANRMTSAPLDMIRAVEPGAGRLLGGDASFTREQMDHESGRTTGLRTPAADVLERLQADPNMMAHVVNDPDDGLRIEWAGITASNIVEGDASRDATVERLKGEGFVKGDDPTVDGALKEIAASQMVSEWAHTANDASEWALNLQDNAVSVFGLKGTAPWDESLMTRHFGYEDKVRSVQQDFLRAQYASTQEYLKANGVTEVRLSRGYHFWDEGSAPEWARSEGEANVPLRPISSWSSSTLVAEEFATGSDGAIQNASVITAVVPAERILSTARTGVGCLNEYEFTVLGGTDPVNVDAAVIHFDEPDSEMEGGEPLPKDADGVPIAAAAGPAARPYDQATFNEDWIKTLHWDLPTDPAAFKPGELAHLATLPAGQAMPAALRDAALTASAGELIAAEFDEAEHPRAPDGRFGSKDQPSWDDAKAMVAQANKGTPYGTKDPSVHAASTTTDHPKFFYHATKSTNRASIAEKGLEANRSLGGKNTRVYLADKDPENEPRMDTAPLDTYKVDTEGIPLRPDPEVPSQWAISETDLEPSRLQLISTTHPDGLTAAGDFDESKHPRAPDGRFGDKGTDDTPADVATDRPSFPDSVLPGVAKLQDGKTGYNREHGLPAPDRSDFSKITADPVRGTKIAGDYAKLPINDPAALASYEALRTEVGQQYDYLTNELGVNVEFVAHDPYPDAKSMVADVRDNNRLQVLQTSTTGPHPFLTDEENDQFRAVHDAFGHAAIGRGFDRNGEEAAYQSHRQMFSDAAIKALATETRGQNSALVYGGTGTFPPQKVALLPPEDIAAARRAAAKQPTADDDNLYDVTHCHHTSLGRTLPQPA